MCVLYLRAVPGEIENFYVKGKGGEMAALAVGCFVMPRVFFLLFIVEVVMDVDLKKLPAFGFRPSVGRSVSLLVG